MSLFNKFRANFSNLFNKDFLKAISSACALVAYADGEVTESEKEKMKQYMTLNPDLKNYSFSEVAENFQLACNSIEFDQNIGRMEANKQIDKIKSDYEQCQKLIAVCIAIGKSDGFMDKAELGVIENIARRLNVNMRDFII